MRSNEQFTKEIIQKAKAARKKKRIVISSITLCVCALLCFFIGYSNIITIDLNPYENSYTNYLNSYLSDENEVGFRFVDKKNAIVQVEDKAYPCSYEANSKTEFTLTVVESGEDAPLALADETPNDEPSVFRLEFWDTSAKLSWNILGTRIEKILSITDERNIPAGLWGLCATQDGYSDKITMRENGAGWTLILENGDSYTGEGMDSAWKTKFISIGDKLFQCMFDSVSGIILDASVFVYDETTFGYPVIRENYLSDGDPYYFYSRLLTDEEKIDFQGGLFTAKGAIREVENHWVENPTPLHKELSKWQLFSEQSKEKSELSLSAVLDLNEDGSVKLKISGNNEFKGSFSGKWYALRHSVLVTLDKKSELLGRAFTLHVENFNQDELSGELIQQYAQSYVESYDCYKTGYHVFDYYVVEFRTDIFWGNEWTAEMFHPTLLYETEYVVYGEYLYEYFDGEGNVDAFAFEESMLIEFPLSGQVSLTFHEDGTATAKTPKKTETIDYAFDSQNVYIEFDEAWVFYIGENFPAEYNRHWRNYTLCVYSLTFRFDCLYEERIGYSSRTNEDGEKESAEVVYYRLYFRPKKDN